MSEIERINLAIGNVKKYGMMTNDAEDAIKWLTELVEFKARENEVAMMSILPTTDTFTADLPDINDLLEQARIGRAAIKALELYIIADPSVYEMTTIAFSVDSLLEWAEKEGTK